MPFTPFHMGVAMMVKPAVGSRFSVISFGVAQVLMDVEPGIGMLRDADVLHGYSHTLPGAVVIGLLATWVASWISGGLLRRWNREFRRLPMRWLQVPEGVSIQALLAGAWVGTFSHLVLDGLLHHDIRPLWPLASGNPFMGLIGHDELYLTCALAIVLGALVWLIQQWRRAEKRSPWI